MNRNILILFMSWLGVTGYGQATSPNETPITIARQGSFAVGGTVLHLSLIHISEPTRP